ncbi:MAG: tRNA1(Val) (adenine(37)-N6)-methyltransferase [Lachnospiraceae bacterium]|nr:tRNA1(Val) (adenine(37)-N6)-methyltransferase [Lachnospiraceae bacterium]
MELKPDERIDNLDRCGYRIIQNTKKFCFGIDAVLLSDFAKASKGDKVVDLGTGTGILPILMEAKTEAESFVAIDIQPESVEMANRSVLMNNQQHKIRIVEGDIKTASTDLGVGIYDVVTSNPPYMNNCHGLVNPNEAKAIARHELKCSLEDVVRESSKLLKVGGKLYMVHRPFRLIEIINMCVKYKLEPKRMRFVHPYVDKEPNMVLIEAVKGGKSMVKIEKPLVVYKDVNVYTDEIHDIYGF